MALPMLHLREKLKLPFRNEMTVFTHMRGAFGDICLFSRSLKCTIMTLKQLIGLGEKKKKISYSYNRGASMVSGPPEQHLDSLRRPWSK